MEGVRNEKEREVGAIPRAKEKGGEESVSLPPFSRPLNCFSRTKTIPSLPFGMSATAEKRGISNIDPIGASLILNLGRRKPKLDADSMTFVV